MSGQPAGTVAEITIVAVAVVGHADPCVPECLVCNPGSDQQ